MRLLKTAALVLLLLSGTYLGEVNAIAVTEVKLDKEFLAGIVEKLPPSSFERKGQYRGSVHSYRLLAIDPRQRRLLATCQVEGEFRPPVSGPVSEWVSRSDDHTKGQRKFRFEIKAGVNIEASPDAVPRFHVDVEEIKREELEGIAGLLAKLLGKYFDDMVTQIADSRAALLNRKLNAEVLKRSAMFRDYGAFCGIDYMADQVVLHFDLTRLKAEGIVGYVFSSPQPGAVPLHRWLDRRFGSHYYTTSSSTRDPFTFVSEGIACYVPAERLSGTIPLYAWHTRKDHLYLCAAEGESIARRGFKPDGLAFFVFRDPVPDAVPLYRFVDPTNGLHFYTTHPHAEFAK
jgi:hypothetical protein